MEWRRPEEQQTLWGAFLRYAQTHCAVLTEIPDRAYVVLIPDIDLILDQKWLAGLLRREPLTSDTAIAYVYLDLADHDLLPNATPPPTITNARVEVFSSQAPVRRLRRRPIAELM